MVTYSWWRQSLGGIFMAPDFPHSIFDPLSCTGTQWIDDNVLIEHSLHSLLICDIHTARFPLDCSRAAPCALRSKLRGLWCDLLPVMQPFVVIRRNNLFNQPGLFWTKSRPWSVRVGCSSIISVILSSNWRLTVRGGTLSQDKPFKIGLHEHLRFLS